MDVARCPRCSRALPAAIGEVPYCVSCRIYVRPGATVVVPPPGESSVGGGQSAETLLRQPVTVPGMDPTTPPASAGRALTVLAIVLLVVVAVAMAGAYLAAQ